MMRHSDFRMGLEFYCGGGKWRCTDLGTRTVIAIRIDRSEIMTSVDGQPPIPQTLDYGTAMLQGWFRGPPYACAELVFDENDVEGCSLEPQQFD